MSARSTISLILAVAISAAALIGVLIAGWAPLLGLDLQGGVAVVLEPTEPAEDESIDQAIGIIRNRVDALGVAEPEITRQGDTIVVQLPGVENQQRALDLVGQTAELRFRPVLQVVDPGQSALDDLFQQIDPGELEGPPTTDGVDADAEETDDGPAEDSETTNTTEESQGFGVGEQALPAQNDDEQIDQPETTTTSEATTTTTEATGTVTDEGDTETEPAEGDEPIELPTITPTLSELELTPPEDDDADQPVILASYADDGTEELRYLLGPSALTGDALNTANAELFGVANWQVTLEFKGGADGIDLFRDIAEQCFIQSPDVCPSNLLAIVLDGRVLSAPTIQTTEFITNQATISGSFDQEEAQDLATSLRFGALPIELEPQQVQEVSATLGQDALDAGLVAGIVGLILVAVFIISYYRGLGVVAIVSLALSGALLWSIISFLGARQGLALTLAGVTGIIVSIGVSVDSNIVYFENLKEDLRTGRSLRSSIEKSFTSAFSTIVKADLASLIGAGLLYFLTVGPVRGFALYLGLATLLDLIVSFFFMRPAVVLLGRVFGERPKLLGITLPEGAKT